MREWIGIRDNEKRLANERSEATKARRLENTAFIRDDNLIRRFRDKVPVPPGSDAFRNRQNNMTPEPQEAPAEPAEHQEHQEPQALEGDASNIPVPTPAAASVALSSRNASSSSASRGRKKKSGAYYKRLRLRRQREAFEEQEREREREREEREAREGREGEASPLDAIGERLAAFTTLIETHLIEERAARERSERRWMELFERIMNGGGQGQDQPHRLFGHQYPPPNRDSIRSSQIYTPRH